MIKLPFYLGCIRPIGVGQARIKDYQLTASSSQGGNIPSKGRLHKTSYWQPSASDSNPYIQLTLTEKMKISGISTQGHFDPVNQFATSYTVAHWENNKWNYGKVYIYDL